MKHLKIMGLAVVAATAFMAFAGAGSASAAPTLTSPAGTAYTGELHATAESSLLLKATFSNVTCTESTLLGHVTVNNSTHAEGPITALTFGNCGVNHPVLVTKGTITINQKTEVFSSNTVVSIKNTSLGITCAYGTTTNTKIGTWTQVGETGTIDISASLGYVGSPHSTGSAFACGNGTWSGSYWVTKPDPAFSV